MSDEDRQLRWLRVVLFFTLVTTGAAGLMYEYVIATTLSYTLGNSIEQFSVTIAIMISMMGVGAFVQQHFKRNLAQIFVIAELLLVMLGVFSVIIIQYLFVTFPDLFGPLKFLYLCLVGFLVGTELPIATRINEEYAKNLGNNIAQTFSGDYLGAAVGGVGWFILLRQTVPITHISVYVGLLNLVVAAVWLLFFWRRGLIQRAFYPLLVALLVVTAFVGYGFTRINDWSASLGQQLYDDPVVGGATTPYQSIVLTSGTHPTSATERNHQLWINGNKQFASADEAIYHEYLVHPAMALASNRERVLILGGGDGLALREVLKYDDVQEVVLVDLDPGMIAFARDNEIMSALNEGAFDDVRVSSSLTDESLLAGVSDTGQTRPVLVESSYSTTVECNVVDGQSTCAREPSLEEVAQVNVFTVDADRFMAEQRGMWDVVIIDLPDPSSVELAKLYSVEFYSRVFNSLSPTGALVVQSTSPYHANETFLAIQRTMTAAGFNTLPYHDNVPSFGDWGWIIGSPTLPQAELHERASTMEDFLVETREVTARNMQRALIFNRGQLESDSNEVSTLMRPTVFEYYVYEAWRAG